MPDISYITSDGKDLAMINPLREKTRRYHMERSIYFKELFAEINIKEAYKQLLEKAVGGILLDLVKDTETDCLVGYCLSIVNAEKFGEIASIYIEPEYRRQYIGYNLMERALSWMDKQGVKKKTLSIAAGNEEVVDFYRHLNFQVRTIVMEQVGEKGYN